MPVIQFALTPAASSASIVGTSSHSRSSATSLASTAVYGRERKWSKGSKITYSSLSTSAGNSGSFESSAITAKIGEVVEVCNDTFWPIVNSAGDKIVVLDMYTQWCGPCKAMAPKFQSLSEKYEDVVFLKLDCNQENKPLAKELGIKVVPTFKILKGGKIVKEITGAKFDDLVLAIESARST